MKKLTTILFALVATMAVCVAQSEPKKMAVATFDITGNAINKDEADGITELYIAELVSTGKVSVVDRANFDKLIKEMKFQAGDWSDKEKTAELGNAANAQLIARGQIIKLGSKLYLSATVIDVKTAIVVSSAKKQFNGLDDVFDLLPQFSKDVVESLSLKIGDIGPGGGTVFYIEGSKAYECSEILGSATWSSAFDLCKNFHGGGYDDWYLPSKDELNAIYVSLRKTGKISGNDWYWSSSPYNNDRAWAQRFSDGYQDTYGKYGTCCVRAVRAFSN